MKMVQRTLSLPLALPSAVVQYAVGTVVVVRQLSRAAWYDRPPTP